MQGLSGEPGEVDDDVLAGEGLLDEWPDPDRRGSKDRRPSRSGQRGGGALPSCVEEFGGGGLEELLGGPAGEHFLQDSAVPGVREAAQGAGEPAVELGAAGVASG